MLSSACVTGTASDTAREERMRLGQEAFAERNYAAAREHYLAVIRAAPDDTQALYRLGNIALYEERPDEAISYYQRVLQIDPQFARAYYNLAVIHLARAEEHFNFYAATLDEGQAMESRLVKLLADMEAFATPQEAGAAKPTDPLDSLGDLLGSGASPP